MRSDLLHLLHTRRFLPLFVTQFLGAANDNLFKNALVILITYRLAQESGHNAQIMVTLAAGLFILPFFLFSATAGQLADQREKAGLIRLIKLGEIGIMAIAGLGFFLEAPWFLMATLFLMGVQSTFFGPIKYAILPDHLRKEELIGGNGLIEAGTFLAILLGTIAGSLLVLAEDGVAIVTVCLLTIAFLGWWASYSIPDAPIADAKVVINPNFLAETFSLIRQAAGQRDLFLSILGISWFWLVGATYLTQFPTFAKDALQANEEVVTLFLTLFSIGIGFGSLWCNRLLKGAVEATFVPYGALGMTIFAIDLYFASGNVVHAQPGVLMGAAQFIEHWANLHILLDLLLIAFFGGIYIVPLYAILQHRSPEARRSRVIAANNIINALFMVVSAVGTMGLFALHFSVPQVFLLVALANLLVTVYIIRLLPQQALRGILQRLLTLFYQVETQGFEHFKEVKGNAVIIANHVSLLDGLLLGAFLPGNAPVFAINTFIARKWWIRPAMALINAFPVDPTNPLSIRALTRLVKEGRHCVIFPEGRITVTGSLMKVYDGPGMVADKAQAVVVPVRIDGAQYTPLSRMHGKMTLRRFPKITLTMLPPRPLPVGEEFKGRLRRRMVGQALYETMSDMMFDTSLRHASLFDALLAARTIYGGKTVALEDVNREPMTYDDLITRALVLGDPIASGSARGDYVGVLLPNSVGAVVLFMALQAYGRIPAMLNYSTGVKNMLSACTGAQIKTIYTSRRFVEMGRLEETVATLSQQVAVRYLEDVGKSIDALDKLRGVILSPFARRVHASRRPAPQDPGVVLFTSGSEGVPKGVVLSHENILSNIQQIGARVDLAPNDSVFNALPIFHSFGLTAGLLTPLMKGIRVFLYPSPLHYRVVPELVYDTRSTVMFGTDTFLTGYARMAHAYDFSSVRLVVAGAEKVKDTTRKVWSERFGLRIFEGYGATETSPVLTINTAMAMKAGSVGRFVPGIEYRLEEVPGIEGGGRLFVRGPNVMIGYLRESNPGVLEPPEGGWYDTGDIVQVDQEGFVFIKGRAKRFAKIGGEMVSLSAVEGQADRLWAGSLHAVVAVNDPRRGEQLILVTDCQTATREALLADARANGIAEIMVPKIIRIVDKMPVLGTGKTDYVAVKALAS